MPIKVIMPKVDMDMSSGRIVTWHVAPGDKVNKGAPLFDIETDKAAMEVEAPASGILRHPVDEGTDVPIGHPVAWLYADDEQPGDPPVGLLLGGSRDSVERSQGQAGDVKVVLEPARPAAPFVDENQQSDGTGKVRATPLARSLAREATLDLVDIEGSGVRGRVQAEDVRAALKVRSEPSATLAFAHQSGPLSVTRSSRGTGTPIVLLHGFASDAMSWLPLEKHLGDSPIIRIELPSHGKSPKQKTPTFKALVSEIRKAFDDLKVEKTHLIGHSLGGALALALADTRERSIESLTLIAPAGLGPEINGAVLDGLCRATLAESLGPWLKTLVADETLITDGYVRAAMATRQDPAKRTAQKALADMLFPDGVQAFDLRAALARLTMPTRLIWGKRDNVIPWRQALRAPGRVALHLFEGLGHLPQIEAPEEIGKIIRAHL